jgi:hypothetical protein
VPWLLKHGLDFSLFFGELFANRLSSFFAFDVIVSAIVLIVFICSEGKRLRMQKKRDFCSRLALARRCASGISSGTATERRGCNISLCGCQRLKHWSPVYRLECRCFFF